MHTEKKMTKDDTWRTEDLKRHIRGGGHEEDHTRKRERSRREDDGRKGRSGESVERRHRDQEVDRLRERERHKEREGTRERTKQKDSDRDRDQGRKKERGKEEGERERRKEGERDRTVEGSRNRERGNETKDRKYERGEKENGDQEKERDRRRAERDREKDREGDREKKREKEHESGRSKERDGRREGGPSHSVRSGKESERDVMERKRRERHSDREHPRPTEEKEYREHRTKEKEERARRRREREERGGLEGQKREEEARGRELEQERVDSHRERKGSERHTAGDREYRDRHRKRRPRDEGGPKELPPDAASREKAEKRELGVEKEDVESGKPSQDRGNEEATEEYEDDFEGYEEDFEDFEDNSDGGGDNEGGGSGESSEAVEVSVRSSEEVEAIRRAMLAENERVGSALLGPRTEEQETAQRDSEVSRSRRAQRGKFIDFVAAKQREVNKKIASKQKKRSTELLRLIDLDFSVTLSLLDLPPVNEYDMYIKSFGTTNTKQAYVQCNEDNADREVQTEDVEMSDRWTQHPADRAVVCGGPNLTNGGSGESGDRLNVDSQRLTAFLRSASQVVAVLLEEDRAEKHPLRKLKSQADSLSFSDGCLQLNSMVPFLHGREVSLICFSQAQRQTMLSVHRPTTKPSAVRLDSKTILCVWNIWEPSRPQKILVYESEVRCCCFGPGGATLVFAGTAVGSVLVWDLREHSSLHGTLTIGESDWTFRYPTFSTDSVLATSGHWSSVTSVEPIPTSSAETPGAGFPPLLSNEESLGFSFQLASLDEKGVLNLWVVLELPKADHAGSQTDLGLRPGGKVKLLHSSSILTQERSTQRKTQKIGPLQALLLKFLPSDSNHFFIGTDTGLVSHGTRHGLKIPPKFYWPQVAGPRPVRVTSVDFSPFGLPVFLVGCEDGSVRLHSVASDRPIFEWSGGTGGGPIISALWSLARPAVFCVLDAASRIHIWDLLDGDSGPVVMESVQADGVTAMAVFGDPAKQNALSGISLARKSGKIEIQYFRKKWTMSTLEELETLQNLVCEAC